MYEKSFAVGINRSHLSFQVPIYPFHRRDSDWKTQVGQYIPYLFYRFIL